MAGAADVGFAALLDHMKGADLVLGVMVLAVGRLHELEEFVVEPFVLEVALLLRHPLVQAEMRLDNELAHRLTSMLFGPDYARANGDRHPGNRLPRAAFQPQRR